MSQSPLVSVIIPTYNRSGTICRAVESVLAQTWKNLEIIVVDDGSKDETGQILEKYSGKIKLVRQKNQGQSAARNNGIACSSGEIISFLDSDDMWLPEKTERQVKLLLKTRAMGVVCSVCNARMIYPSGKEISSFDASLLRPKLKEGVWLNPADVLMTRFLLFNQVVDVWKETLLQAGVFRQDLRIHEDYDLQLRLAMLGSWAFVSEPLAVWYGSDAPSASKFGTNDTHRSSIIEIIKALNGSPTWASRVPRMPFRHRIRMLEMESKSLRLATAQSPLKRIQGKALMRLTRIGSGIYRRTHWFPKMLTRPIAA